MRQTARILFIIVGIIMPIFVGIAHTITYFTQLISPEIEQFLQKEFEIVGVTQAIWNTWGVVNFMMGISFIIIGLLNFAGFRKLSKTDYPEVLPIGIMILYQLGVVYVGAIYSQPFQLYGGSAGLIFLIISLVLTLKHRT